MDNGLVMRTFFYNIPNNWPILANQWNKFLNTLGYFWWYYLLKFCHCVSLVCDFALLNHFFRIFFIHWKMVLGCREFGI